MRTTLRGPFSGAFIHQLERLFQHGTAVGMSEGELLERFVAAHDEAAFEALVARHGPMVLGVCRQFLRDPNDVDDAFQATFLVLVRKAGTLRRRDLLGNWLYGVALRVANRSRCLAVRRLARTPHGQATIDRLDDDGSEVVAVHDAPSRLDSEPSPWLLEEVRRLPEKYRSLVVLCYFEGLTHEQAAARLGWPIGTVMGRLARARDLLRKRLARRGVSLSAGALAADLSLSDGHCAVPEPLRYATLKAARSVAGTAGRSILPASSVSLTVAALADGVLRTMILTHMKAISLVLLVASVVTTGLVLAAAQGPPQPAEVTDQSPQPAPKAVDEAALIAQSKGAEGNPAAQKRQASSSPVPKKANTPPSMAAMMRQQQSAGTMRQMMMGGMSGAEAESQREFRARLEITVLAAALADSEGDDNGQPKKGSLRERLEKPLTMSFANETPLEDVLKYIKDATAGPNGKPIPIYLDPKGLQEAGASLNSTVIIDLDDVPLRMSLRLILKQLGLAYCVRDGVLIISSVQGIRQELVEAAGAAFGHSANAVDEVMESMGIKTQRGIQ